MSLLKIYSIRENIPTGTGVAARVEDWHKADEYWTHASILWDRDGGNDFIGDKEIELFQIGNTLMASAVGIDSVMMFMKDGWISIPNIQMINRMHGYIIIRGHLGTLYVQSKRYPNVIQGIFKGSLPDGFSPPAKRNGQVNGEKYNATREDMQNAIDAIQ